MCCRLVISTDLQFMDLALLELSRNETCMTLMLCVFGGELTEVHDCQTFSQQGSLRQPRWAARARASPAPA